MNHIDDQIRKGVDKAAESWIKGVGVLSAILVAAGIVVLFVAIAS